MPSSDVEGGCDSLGLGFREFHPRFPVMVEAKSIDRPAADGAREAKIRRQRALVEHLEKTGQPTGLGKALLAILERR